MAIRLARSLSVASALAALATILAGVGASTPADAADTPPPSLPACIGISSYARYVPYGYNHIVTLKSGCSKTAACLVSTDVNPQPTPTEVAPGATVEVLTFSGSPAQVFTPRVTCTLK